MAEAGRALTVGLSLNPGSENSININTDNVEVAKLLCETTIIHAVLYVLYRLLRLVVEAVVKKALGGERDDQEVKENEKQASEAGESIKERNPCEDVKNKAMDDVGSDIKENPTDSMEATQGKASGNHHIPSQAAARENVQESYDVTRFVGEVREDLLCSICREVPKDSRLCKNKDHIFCLAHVSRHLENSLTCPYCRDTLTLTTLRRPTGFLKTCLDDLKIKCDHHDRGCPEVVRLEDLPRHLDQCGFAPVMCGNEGCGMVVNKRDKENHEKNICPFRIAKCHCCKEIKASQDEMKASQDEMKTSLNEMKASQYETKGGEGEMKASQDEWKHEMKVEWTEMKDKITAIERKLDEAKDEMKVELKKMKDKITAIGRNQDEIQQSVDEMKQQLQTMMRMFNQALQGSSVNNIGAHVTNPRVSVNSHDITNLGGPYGQKLGHCCIGRFSELYDIS